MAKLRNRLTRFIAIISSLYLISCSPAIQNGCWPAAHRGDRKSGVGNSLTAISSAARAGFPFIEIDVRYTVDGELILFHDRSLSNSNFKGAPILPVQTPEQLTQGIRARSYGCADGACEPIAVLSQAIEAVRGTDSRLLIDIKGWNQFIVEQIVAVAENASALSSIVIQCQSLEELEYISKMHPHVETLSRLHDIAELERAISLHPTIIQLDRAVLSESVREILTKEKILVLVKSLDDLGDTEETWKALRAAGAHIILTDFPGDVARFCRN